MRIVFFGLYDYGLGTLRALREHGFNIVLVVTKPDAETHIQPVAAFARAHNLPVLQPTQIKTDAFLDTLRRYHPDLILVSGFHRLLPKRILDLPRECAINLHASLLPAYRGPVPYKWAITRGETMTGVTAHIMTPEFDAGDILLQREVAITADDTSETLLNRLSAAAARVAADTLLGLQNGTLSPRPQDVSRASYDGYPTDADTRIRWQDPASTIHNRVRGFFPRPGAWTVLRGERVRVWRATIRDSASGAPPGQIVDVTTQGVIVATATHDLVITALSARDDPGSNDLARYQRSEVLTAPARFE